METTNSLSLLRDAIVLVLDTLKTSGVFESSVSGRTEFENQVVDMTRGVMLAQHLIVSEELASQEVRFIRNLRSKK